MVVLRKYVMGRAIGPRQWIEKHFCTRYFSDAADALLFGFPLFGFPLFARVFSPHLLPKIWRFIDSENRKLFGAVALGSSDWRKKNSSRKAKQKEAENASKSTLLWRRWIAKRNISQRTNQLISLMQLMTALLSWEREILFTFPTMCSRFSDEHDRALVLNQSWQILFIVRFPTLRQN